MVGAILRRNHRMRHCVIERVPDGATTHGEDVT
jgi:hypothetical protein